MTESPQLYNRTAGISVPTTAPSRSDLAAHRVSVERLEVEAFICYADVARIAHQRQDHLHRTLHVRLLGYALKALQQISQHRLIQLHTPTLVVLIIIVH